MSKNLKKKGPVTLSGVVTAAKWDANERILDVSVSATDEQEYLVENDAVGKELLTQVHSQIKVTGWVTQSEDGKKRIRVTQFQLIREYDNEKTNSYRDGLTFSH